MSLEIRPVAGKLGAELINISLKNGADKTRFEEIYQALLKHKVLFIRNQHLTDEEHETFALNFGNLVPHPTVVKEGKNSVLFNLDSTEARANVWHTDVTFVPNYPKVSILRGVIIPPYGGDTLWANTASAYEDLPDSLKHLAENLWAHHTNLHDYVPSKNVQSQDSQRYRESFVSSVYETAHPLVHVHAETGERSLILGSFFRHFADVSRADSEQLFRLYQQRITSPHNTVRWRWQEGDVVIWDNRATQHIAVDDYGDAHRVVRRITISGDAPPVSIDGRQSYLTKQPAATPSVAVEDAGKQSGKQPQEVQE